MPLDTMKQFQIIRKKLSKTKTELKSKSVGLKTTIDGIEKTRDKLDSKKSEIKKKIDAGKSHDLKLNIMHLLLPQPYFHACDMCNNGGITHNNDSLLDF